MSRSTRRANRDDTGTEAAVALARQAGPWQGTTTWPVVLGEGIIVLVVGLLIWSPVVSDATFALQLIGLAALTTAGLSASRLVRDAVAPLAVAVVAFRSGVGLTVGVLVVLGSVIAEPGDRATLSLSVILGVGLISYGAASLLGPLLRREPDAPFPLGTAALAVGLVVVGTFLIVRAGAGIAALTETFGLLGLLMSASGMALVGWSLVLRSHEEGAAPTS